MKRRATGCEKILANQISAKELGSRTYKDLARINDKKVNNPIFFSQRAISRRFTREDTQMANEHANTAHHHQSLGQCRETPQRTCQKGFKGKRRAYVPMRVWSNWVSHLENTPEVSLKSSTYTHHTTKLFHF